MDSSSSFETLLTISHQSYFTVSLAEEWLVHSVDRSLIKSTMLGKFICSRITLYRNRNAHRPKTNADNVQLFLIELLPFFGIILLMAGSYGWPLHVIVEFTASRSLLIRIVNFICRENGFLLWSSTCHNVIPQQLQFFLFMRSQEIFGHVNLLKRQLTDIRCSLPDLRALGN